MPPRRQQSISELERLRSKYVLKNGKSLPINWTAEQIMEKASKKISEREIILRKSFRIKENLVFASGHPKAGIKITDDPQAKRWSADVIKKHKINNIIVTHQTYRIQ